jgi:hypothetical protein
MSDKCTVTDGRFVDACPDLLECAEFGNPRGKQKGIFQWAYHSRAEGATRSFFGVKSGGHTDKGMAFSFCPFCGEKISGPFADESKPTGESIGGGK